MDKKDLRVECPCCESRLDVDVRSGHILRWSRKEELDATGKPVLREEDWGEAAKRVSGRRDEARDKFEEGLTREQKRTRDLDDLFSKANEKLKKKPPGDDV